MVNTEPSDVPEDVIIVRGTPRIELTEEQIEANDRQILNGSMEISFNDLTEEQRDQINGENQNISIGFISVDPAGVPINERLNKKKQHPLDKHYPHYCCKKMGGCGKRLWFDELVLANSGKLYTQFEDKIWLKTRDQYLELGFESLDRDLLENLVIMRIHYKRYKYLRKLWKNKNVEFLCCSCYRKATQLKFKGRSILRKTI